MANDELIGSTEAARLLGKSPRTVHRMVDAGQLIPAMTAPGGRAGVYLFNRADIAKIVNDEAEKASA